MHVAVGAAVVGVLTAMALSTEGTADRQPPLPSRAQACVAARQAAAEVREQVPEAQHDAVDAATDDACRTAPTYAPIGQPAAAQPTPGCHAPTPAKAHRRPRPQTARAPRQPIPFFAPRSGELPASGRPVVGGIQLPRGSRCRSFWSTDGGVPDSFALARRLAAAFPETGLWPVVWATPGEEPDSYISAVAAPRRNPRDAETLLRRSWRANVAVPENAPFPGLATPERGANAVDPFSPEIEESLIQRPPPGGWVLVLVPVNRPADVVRVLDLETTEHFTQAELATVLRSWEERFGAVLSALTASTAELAVAARPADDEQARRLAAEHAAFAPEDEGTFDREALARALAESRHWAFGWPD